MKYLKSIMASALLCTLGIGAVSCDGNLVFDGEGDCPPEIEVKEFTPAVQFVFKKHRQALHSVDGRVADAFYSSVESVHLFVYDAETDQLVYDKTEYTVNLLSAAELGTGTGTDRCYLPVELAPGRYRIVAWCGLDESDNNNAFSLVDESSKSSPAYAHCRIKLNENTGLPVNEEKYQPLYHGRVGEVEISADRSTLQIVPVELTKNTNEIAVWVQHTTKTFGEEDYEVVYTDSNGTMHFDTNSMTSTDRLEYHPHTKSLLATDTQFNGSVMETGALVAHLSTARLMEAHQDDARLEVRDKEGRTVFSIPFIKYLLQMQTFTSDHQYYLDCEDTYNCSFYLSGDDGAWMPYQIIINNWVKVPDQNHEF